MDIEKVKLINRDIKNTFGDTFCLAKFYHVTIHLHLWETQSCHHPYVHKIPLEELEKNPSALHNTEQKKVYRKQMFEGIRPEECDYCWNIEDSNSKNISDRHINNYISHSDMYNSPWIQNKDYTTNINPTRVEVSFWNQCQFKCGYCTPRLSSTYAQEIYNFWAMSSSQNLDNIHIWKDDNNNPYIRAWWQWWPELIKTLKVLRITGGEPLLQSSTWRLFQKIEEGNYSYLELYINSNLWIKKNLVEKLSSYVSSFETQEKIKNFELFTSLDTWWERAEYIRTWLNINIWQDNFFYFLDNTKANISIMVTFNALSVTTFKDFLKKILYWRSIYPCSINWDNRYHRIRFQIHYLRQPYQYSIHVLPKKDFLHYMYDSLDFIKDNLVDGDGTKFSTSDLEIFKRVVDYMEQSIWDKTMVLKTRSDFYKWFLEMDRRRNTNFLQVFPEYKDFMLHCKKVNYFKERGVL